MQSLCECAVDDDVVSINFQKFFDRIFHFFQFSFLNWKIRFLVDDTLLKFQPQNAELSPEREDWLFLKLKIATITIVLVLINLQLLKILGGAT